MRPPLNPVRSQEASEYNTLWQRSIRHEKTDRS